MAKNNRKIPVDFLIFSGIINQNQFCGLVGFQAKSGEY